MKLKKKNNSVLAIDITGSSMRICEGEYIDSNQKIKIKKIIREDPYGAIKDGVILDVDIFIDALKKSIKAINSSVKTVFVVFNSSSIIRRTISVKKVDKMDDELKKNFVGMELTKHIPINITEYDIEYQELGVNQENPENINVDVFAFPKSNILKLLSAIKRCDLVAQVLDISDNAITKLLYYYNYVDDLNQTVVAMEIDTDNIVFSIISNRQVKFNRIIDYTIESFDTISSELLKINSSSDLNNILEKQDLKILKNIYTAIRKNDFIDLEALKEYCNLSDDFNLEHLFKNEQLLFLEDVFDKRNRFVDDIEKFIKYYTERLRNSFVDKVFIYGSNCRVNDVFSELERILNANCEILDISKAVNYPDFDELLQYVNAIASMIRI